MYLKCLYSLRKYRQTVDLDYSKFTNLAVFMMKTRRLFSDWPLSEK